MKRILAILGPLLLCCGCAEMAPEPYEHSPGHISAAEAAGEPEKIPELVEQVAPELPEPAAPAVQEKYTVVVNEVPVGELLFALARDAEINVDVDPRVEGVVTLNAIEQTLPQLLERIARQVPLRYELVDDNLFIGPDEPFFRTYRVNYVNMARDTSSAITIATQISSTGGAAAEGGGGGANNSTTEVASVATNRFWGSLVGNVRAILGEEGGGGSEGEISISPNVIPHPETGVLTVRATTEQHKQIQQLVDNTLESAHRQVLIQATIVEVSLSDQYQAGIDWSFVNQAGKAGFDFISTTLTGVPLGTATSFLLKYVDPNTTRDEAIRATLRLLEEFGDLRVLSSPQIMTLNNQTALLKVVDNVVYFTVETDTSQSQTQTLTTVETTVHTVPVGIVMTVTPQINENDSVILNVRPTISRIARTVPDPNPTLVIRNEIPEIRVREMESILRMNSGQIAVLGGLMQDEETNRDNAIPGFADIPVAGNAFKSRTRDFRKTELVIFLRPLVVRNPSLEGDLQQYKNFLRTGR